MRGVAVYAVTLVAALIAVGCSERTVQMQSVNPRGWSQPQSVAFRNSDTLSMRTVSVVLRYNSAFRADTLALRIIVSLPDAGQFAETFDFIPSDRRKAAGVATVESVGYRRHSVLSQCGDYLFTIEPCKPVKGIEAVGINIEKE